MKIVRQILGGLATLGIGLAGGYYASKAWTRAA
jgi:hypothetical protein